MRIDNENSINLTQTIKEWIHDSINADQSPTGKNKNIKSAKEGKSILLGVGISNGKLKKFASLFYKEYKHIHVQQVIVAVNTLFQEYNYLEELLVSFFILEKYNKQFNLELWKLIDTWIDKIDYWGIADHLCINILGYFPVLTSPYLEDISSWNEADNFWRRRLSIVAFLQSARVEPKTVDILLIHINKRKQDRSYYVRKSFSWLLRESTRKLPENRPIVAKFLKDNVQFFSKTELKDANKYLDAADREDIIVLYDQFKQK